MLTGVGGVRQRMRFDGLCVWGATRRRRATLGLTCTSKQGDGTVTLVRRVIPLSRASDSSRILAIVQSRHKRAAGEGQLRHRCSSVPGHLDPMGVSQHPPRQATLATYVKDGHVPPLTSRCGPISPARERGECMFCQLTKADVAASPIQPRPP